MNQKRYWLKGGGIALCIVVLVSLVGYVATSDAGGWFSGIGLFIPLMPFDGVIGEILSVHPAPLLIVVPISLAIYFMVGAVIGWVYGKIEAGRLI